MNREDIEEKIQDLIDGTLSHEEAAAVEDIIHKDESLRSFYHALKELDFSLQDDNLLHPSEAFTGKVMSGLHQPKSAVFDIRSVLILLGLVLCATVGLLFTSQISTAPVEINPGSTSVEFLEIVELSLPAVTLPSSEVFFNMLYFGLLFMALIYFDRVILRQIFFNH